MKVMTFNLRCDFILDFKNRWNNRKNIAFNIINKIEPDIIGLQEVTNKMFIDIKRNLKNYNIVGKPRSKRFFVERNDILISKKFSILEYKTFWLSEKPEKVGSSKWFSIFPRICTYAVIEDNQGKKIRICNSHLDCFFSKAREDGLRRVTEFIEKEQEKEDLPIILMGDFNANPNSKLIHNLKEGQYCTKNFVAVQDYNKNLYNHTTMGMFKGNSEGLHIDYIFVSEDVKILNASIIKDNNNGKYPSDHYPLLGEIMIK